jgi:hypothetical protein
MRIAALTIESVISTGDHFSAEGAAIIQPGATPRVLSANQESPERAKYFTPSKLCHKRHFAQVVALG